MASLFARIGGLSAIKALANGFYDVMEEDPRVKDLRDIHPQKLQSSRKNLYGFLTQWFGGPDLYGEQYLNAEWLALRHRYLDIDRRSAEQWLYCMDTALSKLDLEDELRTVLHTRFRRMTDAMMATTD